MGSLYNKMNIDEVIIKSLTKEDILTWMALSKEYEVQCRLITATDKILDIGGHDGIRDSITF